MSLAVLAGVALVASFALSAIGLLALEHLSEQWRKHPEEVAQVTAVLTSVRARLRLGRKPAAPRSRPSDQE